MEIDAMSLRGYCRTFRPPRPANCGKKIGNMALDPAIRITKLTTIASTGRLMKRSVNDFIYNSEFDICASAFRFKYLAVSDSALVSAQDRYSPPLPLHCAV